MHQTKNSITIFEFFGEKKFYASLKICSFWKLPDFETRHKHRFKRQQLQWKVKAYSATCFKTDLGRFSKQKSYPSCIPLFLVHKFKISMKWFLSGEYQIKTPKHEEIIL